MGDSKASHKEGSKTTRQKFTAEEDEELRALVKLHGDKAWKEIAHEMKTRTTRQCRERYQNYLCPGILNGPWTPEEDKMLQEKYLEYGPKWSKIATFFGNRSDVNVKNRHALFTSKGICPGTKSEPQKQTPSKDPLTTIIDSMQIWSSPDFWALDGSWDGQEMANQGAASDIFDGNFGW